MDVVINTGRAGFVLIDRLLAIDSETIETATVFGENYTQIHTAIEALAQTGALHVRYLNDFKKHAFLLKIDRYHGEPACFKPGERFICGRLVSQSSRAYAYELSLSQSGRMEASGRLLFALQDYGSRFNPKRLETHYRNLFSCLKNAM